MKLEIKYEKHKIKKKNENENGKMNNFINLYERKKNWTENKTKMVIKKWTLFKEFWFDPL